MKIADHSRWTAAKCAAAFSLVEVMVAMALMGVSFVSLFAGISSGVQVIHLAREDLRATQIMVEKLETLRLNAWEQVISGTNIPTKFTEMFYPRGLCSKGITYHGTLTIVSSPYTWANYNSDMRSAILTLTWTNFGLSQTREMRTLVARHGMQNYIF